MSTAPSPFSHDARLLTCARCGAPLPVPLAGGFVKCEYCDSSAQIPARNERPLRSAEVPEDERRQRLFGQLDVPLLSIPADLAGMQGILPPDQIPRAQEQLQAARSRIEGGDLSVETQDRMFFLAISLANVLTGPENHARQRSVVETAAEVLPSPRHQQVLRGMLARNAAKTGDLHAAEDWIALLDPAPDDVHADSAYRYARAYVDTVRQDYRRVLDSLGRRTGELPLTGEVGAICAVLRANALERTGNVQGAVEELAMQMKHSRGLAQATEAIIRINSQLQLCPGSYPRAKELLGLA